MLELQTNIVQIQAIGSVVLLIGFLLATAVFQQRASKQILEVLDNLPSGVKKTELYAAASRYFARRNVPGGLLSSPAHAIPIWFLVIVVTACSAVCYFGAQFFSADGQTPSYVLGGLRATNPRDAGLSRYQSETVFVGCMAFLGAYVWMIHRLVDRINNDDVNPNTYYFLSIRLLAACLVAGISRHAIEAVPLLRQVMYQTVDGAELPVGLAVLGFLIGWNPTLWIDELLIKIRDLLRTSIPAQRWPQKEHLPNNMSLLMLQGMVSDKVDRLGELNIDNVQKLAYENPVILWARTAYTLDLALDFVLQANLAILFEDEDLKKLRSNGIRDLCSYALTIDTPAGRSKIAELLAIEEVVMEAHHRRMTICPTLVRLSELAQALHPAGNTMPLERSQSVASREGVADVSC